MGWTLTRYFFRRHAAITAWSLTAVYILVFLADFSEFARRVSALPGYTLSLGLLASFWRVPFVVLQVIPFLSLFAAIITLLSLNRRYELVVVRAAGVSAWQFLLPLCLSAFLLGLVAVLAVNPLATLGYDKAQLLEADLRMVPAEIAGPAAPLAAQAPAAPAPAPPIIIDPAPSAPQGPSGWMRQRDGAGSIIIGARAIIAQGPELSDAVFLVIGEDGNVVERRDADRAALGDGYWQLTNVRIYRQGAGIVFLASDRLPTELKKEYVQERLVRPDLIPFYELPRKIEVARSFGLNANGFATQFHTLVALPMLLVAMTLIAATVSMRFTRMGQSGTMIMGGVLAGFLLYVVSVLVKAFGNAGFVPPFIVAWIPVVVALFFGVTFLLYKEDG